jgi:hypothetical protein
VEITVVTPPDHGVRPVQPPESVPGVWLLSAERPPARELGDRRVHVTRVRVRAREPGAHAWPEQPVEVETPDGDVRTLRLSPRPFEVVSTAAELPERLEPYGLRAPPEPATGRGGAWGFWGPALTGSAATLLVWVLVAGVRRRRAARRAAAGDASAEPTEPAWVVADRELAAARDAVDEDPRRAADAVAAALSRYVAWRAGERVAPLTTEELAAMRPPGRLRSRWPELLALLVRLDALRFSGALADASGRDALRELADAARDFVERSIPPRELR